jgi:hypothetical protein
MHLVGTQFNFPLTIISLNSSAPELMVTGLTGMFKMKQEIIGILEHETFCCGDQCVLLCSINALLCFCINDLLFCHLLSSG